MLRIHPLVLFALVLSLAAGSTASAQTFFSQSTSSTTTFNTNSDGTLKVELNNTRVAAALDSISRALDAEILIDSTVNRQLEETVDYCADKAAPSDVLTAIVEAAGLRMVVDDQADKATLVLTATNAGESLVLPITSASQQCVAASLQKQVPVMMMHTPLEMVIKFASGMAGVPIELDRVALRRAGIDPFQRVSINSGNATLGQSLTEMLEPIGLTLEVEDSVIVVTVARTVASN